MVASIMSTKPRSIKQGHDLKTHSLYLLNQNLVTESFEIPQRQRSRQRVATTVGAATIDGNGPSDQKRVNTNTVTPPNLTSTTPQTTINYTYPSPCSSTKTTRSPVQESTCTLLSALSFAKDNRTSLAWETLRSLFAVQGSNGFLPKYRYAANTTHPGHGAAEDLNYLPGTSHPSPSLFSDLPEDYRPCGAINEDRDPRTGRPYSCLDVHGRETEVRRLGIRGSGRLAAVPYHATFVFKIYEQSEQTPDDIKQLSFYFARLYRMHRFWMEHVMKGCWGAIQDAAGGGAAIPGALPTTTHTAWSRTLTHSGTCYNVLHPWESMVDAPSPLWQTALDPIVQVMEQSGWIPPAASVQTPLLVPSNKTVHDAMLYLIRCHTNATLIHNQNQRRHRLQKQHRRQRTQRHPNATDVIDSTDTILQTYEQTLMKYCPFAMLDVTQLSALSRAHVDLRQMGSVLRRYKLEGKDVATDYQLDQVERWGDMSHRLLMDLYVVTTTQHDGSEKDISKGKGIQRGFFSKNVRFELDGDDDIVDDASNHHQHHDSDTVHYHHLLDHDRPLLEPSAFQLLAGWDDLPESQPFQNGIVSPILQRDGGGEERFTFGCGGFPIVSWGDRCRHPNRAGQPNGDAASKGSIDDNGGAWIYPVLNYMLSAGLLRNGASGLGTFLRNSTLRMVCDAPNSFLGDINAVCGDATNEKRSNPTFAAVYRTATPNHPLPPEPLTLSLCDRTSTQTAAIVHDLLVPGREFALVPAPPIRHDWVLVLIAAELIVALGIGLSCLLLSLNLMGRLKRSAAAERSGGDGDGDGDGDGVAGSTGVGDGGDGGDLDRSLLSLLEEDRFNELYDLKENGGDPFLDTIGGDYDDDDNDDDDRSSGSNGSSGNSSRSSSNSIFTTRKSRGSTMPQRQNSTTPLVDGGGMDEEEEEEERSVASLSLTNLFRRYQYGQKKE